jgi:hypothetical protein
MTASATALAARAALKEVEPLATSLSVYSTEASRVSSALSDDLMVGARRRRVRSGEPDPVSTVALMVTEDDVLLWREGGATAPAAERRQIRRAVLDSGGELVELYQYEKLEPNQINAFLTQVDCSLNPVEGLQTLTLSRGAGAPTAGPPLSVPLKGRKRRLILIHGTFSRSGALLDGMSRASNGAQFFKRIFSHYEEVLVFDHPTLSVSPVLNAFDLFRLVADARGPLDVIAHSRGGLVARWVLEGLGSGLAADPCQAVLVGAPLGGTSLASPPRLRDALSILSNLGTVLKGAGASPLTYQPLIAAPLALLRIASSVVGAGGRMPVIDAAISMIPGLAAQSRVDLNHELARLRECKPAKPPTYFVVRANFETEEPGWRFWKWFRRDQVADSGADRVFPGPNDLVVDTSSMAELVAPVPNSPQKGMAAQHVHDFKTTETVHHTNYFEQEATLDFILRKLQIP